MSIRQPPTLERYLAPIPTPTPDSDPRDDLAYDRTHLATERTYAAWLRTGLSVAAGGIAVARLVPEPARGSVVALLLGGVFVLLGILIMGYGAWQFSLTTSRLCSERARPIPTTPRSAYVLTGGIALLLVAVLVFLWSHRGTPEQEQSGAATHAVTGEVGR